MSKTSWRSDEVEEPQDALTAAVLPLQGFSASANEDLLRRDIDLLLNGQNKGWQNQAWAYYDRIGELKSVVRYVSNMLSRFNLYAASQTADPSNPERLPETHPASIAVKEFAGGFAGQAELLDAIALYLTVTGECIVAGPWDLRSRPPYPFDKWRAYSTEDISSRNGVLYYKKINQREERLPNTVAAFRAWRPHPRRFWEPDSPTRSALTVLREIDLLDAHVHSSATSRIAGAGLLLLPDEVTIPTGDVDSDGQEVDPFVRHLAEVMSIAIKKPSSAAARVPVMLRGPAEALKELRQLTFDTPFDERVPELRLSALRRLGLSMDIPPEILTGTAESNSWGAWQIASSAVSMHGIPLAQLISSVLTQGWLRPFLAKQRGVKINNLEDILVWFDASNLRVRPNEAEETTAAFDRFEADADALRLVMGLPAETKPTDEELGRQVLLHLVRTNPSMAGYAVNALRENYGIKNLPEFTEKIEAVQTAQRTTRDEEFATDVVPGKRSQDKQSGVPSVVPDANGDDSDNEEGRP